MRERGDARSAVSVRSIEAIADRNAAQFLARMAICQPNSLRWWKANDARENRFMALLTNLIFILQFEGAASEFASPSVHYPSPMLRITLVISEMNRIWKEEYSGEGELQENVVEPAFDLLATLEPAMPQVSLLREFTDEKLRKKLMLEADEALAKIEYDLPEYQQYFIERSGSSIW